MDNHKKLLEDLHSELKPILENSEQSVYVYFGDDEKFCNKKFAALLGYESTEEWAGVEESFPVAFVADESQETLVKTYQKAMTKMAGSVIKVSWKKKSGGTVDTEVILVPVTFRDHCFALHFINTL
jgi:hypothetical protein